jgi:hypothetical protein
MQRPPLPEDVPRAVIREGDFVQLISLAEARQRHVEMRGRARWLPKKFMVHRSEHGWAFIDRPDGSCENCRIGSRCKVQPVAALEIVPIAPRSPKAIEQRLYSDELEELIAWLPASLRAEIDKFDLRRLSRDQMQRLAREASEVLRTQSVAWTQPDGSTISLIRVMPKMPFAEIVQEWLRRAKGEVGHDKDS